MTMKQREKFEEAKRLKVEEEERQARRLATQVNLTRPRTAAELRNRLVDHLRFNLIESLQLQIMSILKHSIWLKILTQP